MKIIFKYILCSVLLCCPYFVMASSCGNGDYRATIEIDKKELSMNDKAVITVTSDYEYVVKYEIEDEKIISINNVGVISPIEIGRTNVDVIVSFIEEDVTVAECTSSIDIDVLSHDSTLKLLNLEEFDISAEFKSDKLEYEVTLPYNIDKINIKAIPNDSSAKISGDGRRYLNEGTNEYEVIVQATDGSFTTYKITILREEANSDNSLKNLIVEGYVLSPKFEKDIYEYNLSVDNSVEEVTINAETNFEFSKIYGVGTYKLASGDNKFEIKVVAENNEEKLYTVIVNKNKGNSKLNSLSIEGYSLGEKFSSDIYTYEITVDSDIDKLEINAVAQDNDKVEVIGNESLVEGENSIFIRVSSDDKGATTYKLLVNKLSKEEAKEIEKNNNLLDILLIIFIVSIVVMVILIIVFVKKNYKNNKKKINKKIIKNKK